MEYDKSKYRIRTWRSPIMLYWIINPVFVINELVLGHRTPKIMLIEKAAKKSLQERTKIPCPHCETIHSGLKWSARNNAFKNWFGLYCDNCGKIIPCLRNLTSLIVLALTAPIWIWFIGRWKKNWLQKQPDRYQNLDLENAPLPFEGYDWIIQGLYWAAHMYVFMTLLYPFLGDRSITLRRALTGIPIWFIAGLVYGYIQKLFIPKTK